jgi:hypothetical protein
MTERTAKELLTAGIILLVLSLVLVVRAHL